MESILSIASLELQGELAGHHIYLKMQQGLGNLSNQNSLRNLRESGVYGALFRFPAFGDLVALRGLGTHGKVEFFHDLSVSGDLIALALLVELGDFETFADLVRLQWMGGFVAQGSGTRNLHWQR